MQLTGWFKAYKPAGITSNQLVTRARKALQTKKIGHTGTLDSFAEGLMIMLVGRATSLADFFLHGDKAYRATFQLGTTTDTHDPEGSVIASCEGTAIRTRLVEQEQLIIAGFEDLCACTAQVPPVYSALKRQGRRYSDLARQGMILEPPTRVIKVTESRVEHVDPERLQIRVYLHVSGGTYIRAFARDLALSLQLPMHVCKLERLQIKHLSLDQKQVWQPIENSVPHIQAIPALIPTWPQVRLDCPGDQEDLRHGRLMQLAGSQDLNEGQDFFIMDSDGAHCLAWAQKTGPGWQYRRIFI
ncbi:MAG: tRNA pseudouridine(55) synthase TruB [Leptospiraceae bacterium]|nr:tRNA pseudouridine(55) synthase TruB [Leptospiraceae bacterium]